ncbi:MAG TPA: hypothetical protein VMQ51_04945 [Candidatus Binatia bacterium]|nr:hypothetical protein [Candidatus Binatia bacterium]
MPPVNPSSGSGSHAARRVVIVVPQHDAKLYDYLKRSFAGAADIQVVLDRRRAPADGPASPVAKDLRRPRTAARTTLGGVLIDDAAPLPPEPPVKNRLWPMLRFDDLTLVTPDPD